MRRRDAKVGSGALQESVELAGEGALEAAADVALALALGDAAGGVGLGRLMMGLADHHDCVQGPIQLAVAAGVDSLGRLGCQVAWLTILVGVVRLARGRSPRVLLRAVTCVAPRAPCEGPSAFLVERRRRRISAVTVKCSVISWLACSGVTGRPWRSQMTYGSPRAMVSQARSASRAATTHSALRWVAPRWVIWAW